MRKPSPRSKLKTLPPETQEALYAYLADHSLAEGVAWLAANGVDTQDSSLSEWHISYPATRRLREASSISDTVKDLLRELPELQLGERQLGEAMQKVFEAEALKNGDSKLYVALRSLRQTDRNLDLAEQSAHTKGRQKDAQIAQKDRDLQLAERRVKLLEEKARKALETVEDSKLSDAEKAARIREIFKK